MKMYQYQLLVNIIDDFYIFNVYFFKEKLIFFNII
jgi:hypothetical protein